jgi:hypothetical protein
LIPFPAAATPYLSKTARPMPPTLADREAGELECQLPALTTSLILLAAAPYFLSQMR